MITQSLDIFIGRPPEVVFDFLSEPANLPRWNPTFQTAGWASSGAPGAGSTFRATVKVLGSKEVSAEISAWEPARQWGYSLRTPIFPMRRFETTYTLEPEEIGTKVNVVSRTESAGVLRLFEGLFVKMGNKEVRRNLVRLRSILEASYRLRRIRRTRSTEQRRMHRRGAPPCRMGQSDTMRVRGYRPRLQEAGTDCPRNHHRHAQPAASMGLVADTHRT